MLFKKVLVSAKEPVLDIEHIFDDVIGEFDIDKYYALTDSFISFGPTFRYLNSAFLVDENIVVGELQIPGIPGLFSDVADPNFRCNPILVDNVGRFVLCSLHPDEEKLTFSVVFQMNGKAEISRKIGRASCRERV